MSRPDSDKARIRREFLEARRQLDAAAWRGMSDAITERLLHFPPYQDSEALLTYVASKDNEADTHTLIDHALTSGKLVWVPVMGAERGLMRWSLLRNRAELAPARFGLLEPAPAFRRISEPPHDAACVVPGVAFTRDGRRIGYGGGYYDRFLSSFTGATLGIAFDIQLAATLPVEAHDQRVDYVFTNTACYRTNNAEPL